MNTNNNQHDQQQQQQHSQHRNIQCKPISSSHHHKNHHLFVQSMKQLFPTTSTHHPPQPSSSSSISTSTSTTTHTITNNNNNNIEKKIDEEDDDDEDDLVIHVVQETRLTDPNPFFHTYGGTRNSHIHSRSSPPTTPPPPPFSSSPAAKSILVPLKISNNNNNNNNNYNNNNTHNDKESSIISSTTRIQNRKRKWNNSSDKSDESVDDVNHHHGSSTTTSSSSSIMPHFVKRRMIEQQQQKKSDDQVNEMTMIVLDDDEKDETHKSDQTIIMTTTTPQEKQVLNERKLSDFSLNDDPLLEIVMKHSPKTIHNDTRVSNVASLTRHSGSQSQKSSSHHHHHGGMMTGSNDVKSSRNSGNSGNSGSHVVEPNYVKLDQNMTQRYAVILMGDQWMTLLDQITYQSIGNDGEELVVMSIDRMRLSHSVVRSGETRFCEIQMRRRHMSDPWTLTVDRQMFFGFKILKNNIIDDDELLKHRLEDDRCVDIIIVGNAHRPTRFFIQSQSNTNCYTLADMEQTANHSLRMLQAAGYLKRSSSDDTNEKTPLSKTNSITATTASSTLEIITQKPATVSSQQNSSTTGSQNTPFQTSSQTSSTSSSSMPSKAKTISDAQEEDEEEFDFNYDDLIGTKTPVKSSTRSSSRMYSSPSINTRSNAKHQMEIIDDEDVVPVKSIPKPKLTPKEAAEPLLRLYNITITKGDLARLEPGEYLNDNIVDFYYQFINENKFAMSKHHFHIFNSHFYPLLLKDAARAAKRVPEPDKVKIFECDWLFIPMCENEHWTLAVVTSLPRLKERIEDHMAGIVSIDGDPSPDDPMIFICDSLNLVDREQQHKITHLIRHYLSQRYMIEYGNASSGTTQPNENTYSITRRDLKLHRSTVPQQSNYCDCGVYMLEYTDRLLTERYRHANRGLDESVLEMTEDYEKPNFELPFQNRKWFPSRDIKNKRKCIKQIILDKISDLGPALPSISIGSTLGDSLQMLSQDPTASPLLRDKTQSSDGCNTTSEDTKGDTETIGIKDSQQTKSSEEQKNDINESPTSPRIEVSPCSPSDTPISHGDKKAPCYDFTPSPELF